MAAILGYRKTDFAKQADGSGNEDQIYPNAGINLGKRPFASILSSKGLQGKCGKATDKKCVGTVKRLFEPLLVRLFLQCLDMSRTAASGRAAVPAWRAANQLLEYWHC